MTNFGRSPSSIVLRCASSITARRRARRSISSSASSRDYKIGLSELLPYLPEAYELFPDSNEEAPNMLPAKSVRALFGEGCTAWLRVEIDPHVLRQRNLRPERLLSVAKAFGERFRLVTTQEATFSFDSIESFTYGSARSEVVGELVRLYDEFLIASDRSFPGPRQFVVLSERPKLLSHEAVAFAAPPSLQRRSVSARRRRANPHHQKRMAADDLGRPGVRELPAQPGDQDHRARTRHGVVNAR